MRAPWAGGCTSAGAAAPAGPRSLLPPPPPPPLPPALLQEWRPRLAHKWPPRRPPDRAAPPSHEKLAHPSQALSKEGDGCVGGGENRLAVERSPAGGSSNRLFVWCNRAPSRQAPMFPVPLFTRPCTFASSQITLGSLCGPPPLEGSLYIPTTGVGAYHRRLHAVAERYFGSSHGALRPVPVRRGAARCGATPRAAAPRRRRPPPPCAAVQQRVPRAQPRRPRRLPLLRRRAGARGRGRGRAAARALRAGARSPPPPRRPARPCARRTPRAAARRRAPRGARRRARGRRRRRRPARRPRRRACGRAGRRPRRAGGAHLSLRRAWPRRRLMTSRSRCTWWWPTTGGGGGDRARARTGGRVGGATSPTAAGRRAARGGAPSGCLSPTCTPRRARQGLRSSATNPKTPNP